MYSKTNNFIIQLQKVNNPHAVFLLIYNKTLSTMTLSKELIHTVFCICLEAVTGYYSYEQHFIAMYKEIREYISTMLC